MNGAVGHGQNLDWNLFGHSTSSPPSMETFVERSTLEYMFDDEKKAVEVWYIHAGAMLMSKTCL